MTRTSADQFGENGLLINGFDYINQAWVLDGKYQDCGHPKQGEVYEDPFEGRSVWGGCDCYGRLHSGEPSACWRADNERRYQRTAKNGHHPDCDNQELPFNNLMCSELCPMDPSRSREYIV